MLIKKRVRLIATICVLVLLISNFVFAGELQNVPSEQSSKHDISASNKQIKIHQGKLFKKGLKNLFNINKKTGVYVTESSNDEITYNIDYYDDNKKMRINGTILINNKTCNYNAEGMVKHYEVNSKEFDIGILDGEININGKDRKIIISVEKYLDNEYITYTINSIDDKEGFVIIECGSSSLTNEDYEEGFRNTDNNDSDIGLNSEYEEVDRDYEEIESAIYYPQMGIKEILYIEDDIYMLGDDGPILSRTFGYKDNIRAIFEDDYQITNVEIVLLHVTCESKDQESRFGGHRPSELDSDNEVGNFIAGVLGDLGVPSIITSLAMGVGNDIDVLYPNDLYDRIFKIYPDDDAIFEDGGYPVIVNVDKDGTATDDDISTKAWLMYRVTYDDFGTGTAKTFNVYTQNTYNTVDLANY